MTGVPRKKKLKKPSDWIRVLPRPKRKVVMARDMGSFEAYVARKAADKDVDQDEGVDEDADEEAGDGDAAEAVLDSIHSHSATSTAATEVEPFTVDVDEHGESDDPSGMNNNPMTGVTRAPKTTDQAIADDEIATDVADAIVIAATAALAERFPAPSTITDWSWLPKSDWPCRAAAIAYVKHGFEVVLLHGVKKFGRVWLCSCTLGEACPRKGKHPRYKDWQSLPGGDPTVVAAWFRYWSVANVGIKTGGTARLFVLDVDPKNGGVEALTDLEARNEKLLLTLTASTPNGGLHKYFFVPDGIPILPGNSQGKIGSGLDSRCDGPGLVVAAPSRTENGQYIWQGIV